MTHSNESARSYGERILTGDTVVIVDDLPTIRPYLVIHGTGMGGVIRPVDGPAKPTTLHVIDDQRIAHPGEA